MPEYPAAYSHAVKTAFPSAPATHSGHLDRIAEAPESIYPALQYADWLAANGQDEAADIIGQHVRDRQRQRAYGLSGVIDPDAVVTFPADQFFVHADRSHYTGDTAITLKRAYKDRPGTVTWNARLPTARAEELLKGLVDKGAVATPETLNPKPVRLSATKNRE